ncbi:MAG: glycosyltransferase [Nanoarchaeota archaeon]|nr:glycosyltransferase [Nanoarchaeota archaeon]
MMKICFIGNLESMHLRAMCNYFKGRHDVHVITWKGDMKGVTVHKIYRNLYGFFINLFLVKKILKKIKPDIVHAQYLPNAGVYAAFSGVKPFFADPMGEELTNNPLMLIADRYVFRKVDALITHENEAAERIREIGYKGRIIIKARGVNLDVFKNRHLKKKNVITICRHIHQEYSTHVFFKAIKYVLKEFPDMKFLCIAQYRDPTYLKKIENIIKEDGIEKNVKIMSFIEDFNEFTNIIGSSKALIDTYYSEERGLGLGYGNLEAMALGTPVISAKRPLLLRNPKWFYGLIYEDHDEKDLANKIIYLLKNEKLQKNIIKKSEESVKNNFDLNKNMKYIEKQYESYIRKG